LLPVLAVLCLAGLCVACASHGSYTAGQPVKVQGLVTDRDGRPQPDLQVGLEASRLGYSVYPIGKEKRDLVTGSVTTDRQGDYALEFPWNDRYDHFELVVSVPVATPHGADRVELSRQDITKRVEQGTPVAVPVTLADTKFLATLREFLASLRTDEEQRTYQQVGRPDRVDRNSSAEHTDTAWWYFEQGKVYRFRDGHLQNVDTFAPVKPVG
jgi:hypothetical protein